jgi:hypothetical protein
MSEYICPECETDCKLAPAIGHYCPNSDCPAGDRGQPKEEYYENSEHSFTFEVTITKTVTMRFNEMEYRDFRKGEETVESYARRLVKDNATEQLRARILDGELDTDEIQIGELDSHVTWES